MTPRTASSVLRILILFALVIAATAGGRQIAAIRDATPTPDIAMVTPTATTELVVNLEPTATSAPTAVPTVPPTAIPTPEPTPEPTAEPDSGPGDFTVPENTTDASIIVERGPSDKQYVALSFDCGEGRGYTVEILDYLKEHGLKGNFGITGTFARDNPDLILRMVNEGHLIFNHSQDHASWTGVSNGLDPLTDEERTAEVLGAEEAVLEVADWNMQPFWRPPYGDWDPEGQVLLKSLGYDYTLWWTCDTLGWNGQTADEIVDWCSPDDPDRGGPGAIILFHVTQEQDWLALPGIVDEYQAEGYEIVTLDKMIEP
ncbi:MAG: polysaccharide deacetylase family protein [Thermomicrobiales bacterium]|nr:polysaccharide deacetylase family protein [Thermomicrobiales bacterium]